MPTNTDDPSAIDLIPAGELSRTISQLFRTHGMTAEDADAVASALMWAELRGRRGHGLARIDRYLEMIELGEMDPRAAPEVVRSTPAITVIDAHHAPGPVALRFGADAAADQADASGGSFCLVSRTTHTGALGIAVDRIARRGHIGIALAAGKPLMAYHGSRQRSASTSPLAIAVPTSADAVVLDMSTSAISAGGLAQLAARGGSIGVGLALDGEGNPTTDAASAVIPLPMGGAKGSGLAVMFEMLTGVLAGAPVLAGALGAPGPRETGQNALLMALNIATFGDSSSFVHEVERLSQAIRDLEPREGCSAVRMPGDAGWKQALRSEREGIAVPSATMRRLQGLAGC